MSAGADTISLNGRPTTTSKDQERTQTDITACFKSFLKLDLDPEEEGMPLKRDLHKAWLSRSLFKLPTNFAGLDASRPWFVFWISHALELLEEYDSKEMAPLVGNFLKACQHPEGGFGGGPGQIAHLAPTYAGTAALLIAGEAAYEAANRERTYKFLMRMKTKEGGFMMHDEGETDMRGTYCAIATASMLHIITDELIEGVPGYIRSCQTYEGGLAGEEGLEAHGGYSYCGLAALCILGKADVLDLHAFLNWVTHRQMCLEGGFQGRTNKLVDSCYSFWQGAIFPLLHEAFRQQGPQVAEALCLPDHFWFEPDPLQIYVFLACQHPGGGLRDKPGKSADYYHSCYSLSGVATAMYGVVADQSGPPDDANTVIGLKENKLPRNDFYYNIIAEKAERKVGYFDAQGSLIVDDRELGGREGEGAQIGRRWALKIPHAK